MKENNKRNVNEISKKEPINQVVIHFPGLLEMRRRKQLIAWPEQSI